MDAEPIGTHAAELPAAVSGSLWLVRHAQPLVAPGICYGATDMPADVAATQDAARALAPLLPAGARLLYSPLLRCAQLAGAVRALRCDLHSSSDPRLVEMDFGCWEGWPWADIPKAALDAWTAQFGSWRFGGRESVQELMHRVAGAWGDACATDRPMVWITHAGVIRTASLLAQGTTGITDAALWPREAPAFGAHVHVPLAREAQSGKRMTGPSGFFPGGR